MIGTPHASGPGCRAAAPRGRDDVLTCRLPGRFVRIAAMSEIVPPAAPGRRDQRRAPRHLVFATAKIVDPWSPDGPSAGAECAILNLSTSGACLLVENAVTVPERFTLRADSGRLEARCTVVWRNRHHVGVTFETPVSLPLDGWPVA